MCIRDRYQELTKQDKVFKGNSVLEVEANAFSYKLLLDGQIILSCSTFAVSYTHLDVYKRQQLRRAGQRHRAGEPGRRRDTVSV